MTRRIIQGTVAFISIAGGLFVAACSSAPSDDGSAAKSEEAVLTMCAPLKVKVCYPGEGPGGTTPCDCEGTGPACTTGTQSCGATLNTPSQVFGCSRGLAISTSTMWGVVDVWTCPGSGASLPTSMNPVAGKTEYIVAIASGSLAASRMCDSCVGAPDAGYYLLIRGYLDNAVDAGTDVSNGNCGGPCSAVMGR